MCKICMSFLDLFVLLSYVGEKESVIYGVSVQKFEAYDSNGAVVAGDKNKEVRFRVYWLIRKNVHLVFSALK